MPKIIFINDTAAIKGGSLTVLKQFLEEIHKYSQKEFVYYIFCSLEDLKVYESEKIKIINNIKAKKWLDRVRWDFYGFKKWSQKNKIKADLLISLQNTAPCYFKNTKKIVYIHQALSFVEKIKWNPFKKEERLMWFYQKIYPFFIKLSVKDVDYLIVQTEWMKKAVVQRLNFNPEKVMVIPPSVSLIDINSIKKISFGDKKFHIFYPAFPHIYKNHQLIIKAIKYIKDQNFDIYSNLLVHFTFSLENSCGKSLLKLINKLGIKEAVKLEGILDYQRVLEFYKSVDLVVFPSYIETFGLPLIEAAFFGLPLLVSDLDFSREVVGNYEGAQFLDYKDEKLWAEKIMECYNKRPRFKSFRVNFKNSWKVFFDLIERLVGE
ncbi:MAG: glycosyltransferase [Minisyncoccia bacterium]